MKMTEMNSQGKKERAAFDGQELQVGLTGDRFVSLVHCLDSEVI